MDDVPAELEHGTFSPAKFGTGKGIQISQGRACRRAWVGGQRAESLVAHAIRILSVGRDVRRMI